MHSGNMSCDEYFLWDFYKVKKIYFNSLSLTYYLIKIRNL